MPPLILHHFDASPFAEKIRLVLGFKDLDWLGVQIPMVMPKPDLVALTGGHRRTPVLQIGADIYCDSALIARVLDARAPARPLYPASAPLAPLLAQWADWSLFWTVIDVASQPAAVEHRFRGMTRAGIDAIVADRTPFRATVPRQTPADAAANLATMLGTLAAPLSDGRPFLLGECSIFDFSVAHCLWHLRRAGPVAEPLLAAQPALLAWHDRMLAPGHGRSRPLASAEALAIAATAPGHVAAAVQPGSGFAAGQRVRVAALDYGTEPALGTLVGLTPHEVVLEHRDARAGTLHVHFPRSGFGIAAG